MVDHNFKGRSQFRLENDGRSHIRLAPSSFNELIIDNSTQLVIIMMGFSSL